MIVYEVTCLADGRRYIGSTTQRALTRWEVHRSAARKDGNTAPLYAALREHGPAAFVIREVACAKTEPTLRALERTIIAQEKTAWPTGLNAGHESGVRQSAAWKGRLHAVNAIREGVQSSLSAGQCRAARSVLGWSREELARAANVSRSAVSDFETDRRETLTGVRRGLRKALEAAGVEFPAREGGKASIVFIDDPAPKAAKGAGAQDFAAAADKGNGE